MVRLSFSLRARLLLVGLCAVAPVIILTLYLDLDHRQRESERARAELMGLARLALFQQQQLTQGTHLLLSTLAQAPPLRAGPIACSAFLADLLKRYSAYANFGLIEPNGDTRCSALPYKKPLNLSDRRYFQDALQSRAFSVGEAQVGRVTRKPTQNFGYHILNPNGKVKAVLFAALDLSWLNRFAQDAKLPADSAMLVVDHQGTLLARYPEPEKWVGTNTPTVPIVQIMLAHRAGGFAEAEGIDGVTRLYAFTPLDDAVNPISMRIGIGMTRHAVFAAADRILVLSIAGLAVASVLALVAVWWIGRFLILQQAERLKYQATHDELTGLAHRALFYDHLHQAILTSRRTRKPFALLMMDLNRFKEINDTLGHPIGDRLLQEVATRLRGVLRESDIAARLGGDEFAALLPDTDAEGAIQSVKKLATVLAQPLVLEQHSLTVGVSIGVVLCPTHGSGVDRLIRCADTAMYDAKRTGTGYKVYTPTNSLL